MTVKSAATAEAGAELAHVLGQRDNGDGDSGGGDGDGGGAAADPVIISLQNGVRNAATLRAALPGRTVLAGMVGYNVARLAPGHYHRGTIGEIVVEAHAHAGLAAFLAAAARAELRVVARKDIVAVQWGKLVMNLNNAINALSGRSLADQLGDRDFRRCLAAAMREALHVLRAARVPVARVLALPPSWVARLLTLPDWAFRPVAKRMAGVDPGARSSMADDFAARRKTEVDYLQGEVVALAEQVDAPAPVNRKLVELVHAAEDGGKREFSGKDLRSALGV